MRAFACPDCSSLVPFEATRCLISDSELGLAKLRIVHDLVEAHLPYRTPAQAQTPA